MNGKDKKKKSRVSPKINLEVPGVTYNDLSDGDCFIMDKQLWIKSDTYDYQNATNLITGEITEDLCDQVVIPVDVEIKWIKKK